MRWPVMSHLHRMDFDICLERHRVRSRRAWAKQDSANRWAVHNQIVDEEHFRHWFYEDSCVEHLEIQLETIQSRGEGRSELFAH